MKKIDQHPIIDVVVGALERQNDAFVLTEAGFDQVAEALRAYFGQPGLPEAVRALLIFAFFLEQKKRSPAAANTIIDIVMMAKEPLAAQQIYLGDKTGSSEQKNDVSRLLGQENSPQKDSDFDAPIVKWWQSRVSSD